MAFIRTFSRTVIPRAAAKLVSIWKKLLCCAGNLLFPRRSKKQIPRSAKQIHTDVKVCGGGARDDRFIALAVASNDPISEWRTAQRPFWFVSPARHQRLFKSNVLLIVPTHVI